ncbi:MAG: fibronectin type III domain-containing protein, partial [bacterium]|nr:fibronectin type III domain-containing protein [bacterium]
LVQVKPLQPVSAPIKNSLTNKNQIVVDMTAISSPTNGGSPIISYELQYDNNSGGITYTTLVGASATPSMALQYTLSSLISGKSYMFKYRGINIYGDGVFSNPTTIVAGNIPSQPSSPTVSYSSSDIKITWTDSSDMGGLSATKYRVKVKLTDGSYKEDTTNCDGTDSTIKTNKYCDIPMSVFWTTPYSFKLNDAVVAKVEVENSLGWSAQSNDSNTNIVTLLKPTTPSSSPTNGSTTTESQIELNITPISSSPENGGSPINNYTIEWDNGTTKSTWTKVTPSNFTSTSLTLKSPSFTINSGTTYYFKYSASNIYGDSSFSGETSILAAVIPTQPQSVVTSNESDGSVKISWNAPSNIGATSNVSILEYQAQVKASDNNYYSLASCGNISSTSCSISMSTFFKSPYNLVLGNDIVAEVKARNVLGWGSYSSASSTNASTKSLPQTPTTPPIRNSSTSQTNIFVDITSLTSTQTGLSPILSYNLQWDQGVPGYYTNYAGYDNDNTNLNFNISSGIISGKTYSFKYRAKNIYGWGAFSSVTSIIAATISSTPSAVSVTDSGSDVKFSWTAPNSGGNTISNYKITISTDNGSSYAEILSNCDGTDSTIKLQLFCTVPMSLLNSSPYSCTPGQLIRAKIKAENSIGWSAESTPNTTGSLCQTVPSIPSSVPSKGVSTSMSQVEVDIAPLSTGSETGYSTITGYEISWDQGKSSYLSLIGLSTNFTKTSYLITSGISVGVTYAFKYRAKNIHGWGDYSSPGSILAASPPNKMSTITFSITGTQLTLNWLKPSANGSDITAYSIRIQQKDGFFSPTASCDTSIPNNLVTTFSCTFDQSILSSTPYNLLQGDYIIVKASATNSIGTGPFSDINTTSPKIMIAPPTPTSPITDGSSTNETQIDLNIPNPSNDGGSPITSYNLQWNSCSGSTFTPVTSITYPNLNQNILHTDSSITSGVTCQYKYTLTNIVGTSLESPVVSILASTIPDKMSIPTLTVIGKNIEVTVLKPNERGSSITSYIFQIKDSINVFNTVSNCSIDLVTFKCTFSMSDMLSTPFSLTTSNDIVSQVSAVNSNGQGSYSDPSTPFSVQSLPSTPVAPGVGSNTKDNQAEITITHLTGISTGNSAILSYQIECDSAGNNAFSVVTGNHPASTFLGTSYTYTGLSKGSTYNCKYKAINVYGSSPYSSSTAYKTATIPDQMSPLVSLNNGPNVKITFGLPDNKGDSITSVYILIQQKDGGFSSISGCNSANPGMGNLITNLNCSFSMSELLKSPFNLLKDDYVYVKAAAENSYGKGAYSILNTSSNAAIMKKIPDTPSNAPSTSSVTKTQVVIAMTAVSSPNDGGSSVTSYNLQYDNATNGVTWTDLVGYSPDSTNLTFTKTGLSTGSQYKFRYRVKNVHGWSSSFSPILSVYAAVTPSQPTTVTTSLVGTDVKVSWDLSDDGGLPITKYEIKFQDNTSAYKLETTNCDGTQSSIISQKYCLIPMLSLASSPLSLPLDTLLVGKVSATNIIGTSTSSSPNTTGIKVQGKPLSPPSIPTEGTNTNDSQIEVDYTALVSPNTGYSSVTSYSLEWDSGSNGLSFTPLVGYSSDSLNLTYTKIGLTSGQNYIFKYRAKNIYGWGPYSSDVTIKASTIPSKLSLPPTTTNDNTNVKISWGVAYDGGETISEYKIEIKQKNNSFSQVSSCLGTNATIISNRECLV